MAGKPTVRPQHGTALPKPGTVSAARWRPYLMLGPALVLLLAFTIYPMFSAAYTSLFQINMATQQQPVWTGLGNYAQLFASETFRKVLLNTLLFSVGTLPPIIFLSMFLAVQVNKRFRSSALFRTIFFYPTVIPMMSVATIWLFMYTPQYGIINRALGFFGVGDINFLGNSSLALPAIMLMSVWKETGYFMLFYLAGLQNLPGDIYEAADLDGASAWTQFRKITFPLLMPTTMFVMTVASINAFKTVDQVFLMTAGGPNNATNLMLYHLFEQAFSFYDKGVASAMTVILVIILLVLALVQNKFDKRVHYN